ncbi:MAG: ankyrin [Pseudomonadota bacterium]
MGNKPCPDCKGKKMIVGNCECNNEWRTTDGDGNVDDCRCDPDQNCPTCKGTGVVTD